MLQGIVKKLKKQVTICITNYMVHQVTHVKHQKALNEKSSDINIKSGMMTMLWLIHVQ